MESVVNEAWEIRQQLNASSDGIIRSTVEKIMEMLDQGTLRVAEKKGDVWHVNEWVKKAILLSFRLNDCKLIGDVPWYDKVELKFSGWDPERFKAANFRAVPGSYVRKGACIG